MKSNIDILVDKVILNQRATNLKYKIYLKKKSLKLVNSNREFLSFSKHKKKPDFRSLDLESKVEINWTIIFLSK